MRRMIAVGVVAFVFGLVSGCVGCEDEIIHADECHGDECIPCGDHTDCDDGAYCGELDGDEVCLVRECEPGESHCEGEAVVRCDEVGSGWLSPEECDVGVCDDGRCGCADADDCADGELCEDGFCECPSGVQCDDGTCCGDGEVCDSTEICDDSGDCEIVSICRVDCQGQFCGAGAQVCCEGETPICGPTGECAPDCSDVGDLCGDNFDECCEEGDVCVYGNCVTPGEPCEQLIDCGFEEYCDVGLGRCMPDEIPDDVECTQEWEFEEFDAEEKWSWTDGEMTSVPLVGDVTGDGETNVVVNAMRQGDIVILDNQGNEIRRIEHDPSNDQWGAHWRSNPALADLTGDGRMEIIFPTSQGTGCCSVTTHIAAIDGDGETVWVAHDEDGDHVEFSFNTGAIGAANLNGDSSTAEIMAGAAIIDSQGRVVWNEGGDGTQYGSAGSYTGGVTIAADLLDDGKPELVTGSQAWTLDWEPASDPDEWPEVELEMLWENNDGEDGYPAIADMNGNGDPEVVIFASRTLRIVEGDTGELFCAVDPSGQACEDDPSLRTQPAPDPSGGGGRGGPPTVADFSGDGRPEVGVAGRDHYTVFDINRPAFGDDDTPEEIDEDLLEANGQPMPEEGEIFIRWYNETQDASQATGSSVFDFQGDGSASVVYNDECYLRVYSGYDGEIELRLQNSTGTRIEYPIVVDVDENGRSEIVVGANTQSRDCDDWDPDDDYELRGGLYVYEDPNELWVHTRSIWNQHAYSIDNIHDDGSIPDLVDPWWKTHNTFRANRQGEVPLHAPDVVVENLLADATSCPSTIHFQVTVRNGGMRVIPQGVPITLYNADTGEALETKLLDEMISPGGVRIIEFDYEVPVSDFNVPINYRVIANDDDELGETVFDCDPDRAMSETLEAECIFEM